MKNGKVKDIGVFIKKYLKAIIGIILFVIIMIIILLCCSRLYKLDVTDEINPKYSGYSGRGDLTYNSEEVDKKIFHFLLKKQGIKTNIIDGLVKEDSDVEYAVMADPNLVAKVSKVTEQKESIIYDFDKKSNLKNGDTVTFTLKNTSDKIPIKEVKKEFKVKGLKKSSNFTISDILKEHPVKFTGYDTAGKIDDDLSDLYSIPENNEQNSIMQI